MLQKRDFINTYILYCLTPPAVEHVPPPIIINKASIKIPKFGQPLNFTVAYPETNGVKPDEIIPMEEAEIKDFQPE